MKLTKTEIKKQLKILEHRLRDYEDCLYSCADLSNCPFPCERLQNSCADNCILAVITDGLSGHWFPCVTENKKMLIEGYRSEEDYERRYLELLAVYGFWADWLNGDII